MGRFVKGDVVVIPFPFSDLSNSKRRPALVVTDLSGDDVIFCLITTQNRPDRYSISLLHSDFLNGSLQHASFIRPNRLFTGDARIIRRLAGTINQAKIDEVVNKIIEIIQA